MKDNLEKVWKVEVLPHDSTWREQFEAEALRIQKIKIPENP